MAISSIGIYQNCTIKNGYKKPRSLTASGFFMLAFILSTQHGCGDGKAGEGYLLFCGRTRKMTQYAAVATADIDPDGTPRFA